jgi:uncharacterized protein (TIGR02145 family)
MVTTKTIRKHRNNFLILSVLCWISSVYLTAQSLPFELLKTNRFNNGDLIPEAKSSNEWEQMSMNHQPAFMRKVVDGNEYYFFNWYVLSDLRGLVGSQYLILDQYHLTIFNAHYNLPIRPVGIISEQGFFTKLTDQQYYWTTSEFMEKGNRESAVCVSVSCENRGYSETKRAFKQEGFLVWVVEKEKLSIAIKEATKLLIDAKKTSTTTITNNPKTETNSTISNTPILTSSANDYKSVKIGNQIWMTENLNVDRFRNGDLIPEAKTKEEWELAGKNKKPAWCYYDNDPKNGEKYGKLYNWYAVNDPRGLAPKDWHIPSDNEWDKLVNFLGGENRAGLKMKNTRGWGDNSNGDNKSGFTGLPCGYRSYIGGFYFIGYYGTWWSCTEYNLFNAWGLDLFSNNDNAFRDNYSKNTGFTVRCVKD